MPENNPGAARDLPHIPIIRWRESAQYTYPKTRRQRRERRDDYHAHAEGLLQQLAVALGDVPAADADNRSAINGLKRGVLVELDTMMPGERAKATKVPALDFPGQGIAVLKSERLEDRTEKAIIFVPDDARNFLNDKLTAYGNDNLGNQPRPDIDRFEVIEHFRPADSRALLSTGLDGADAELWWELWLRGSDGQQPDAIADAVAAVFTLAGLQVHADRLRFPDTAILFVRATSANLLATADRVRGAITDIRQAAGDIELLLAEEGGLGQQELVDHYAGRLTATEDGAPVVCILDTGVSGAHPLIAPGLAGAWAVNEAWNSDDHAPHGGHGTGMAGLVLHGDLVGPLSDDREVALGHAVESVKLLPPLGFPATEPARWGIITQSAVSVAETERPNVPRSFCIATSSAHFSPDAPSSWSGALDQICAGSMLGERQPNVVAKDHPKRLIVIATGNMIGGPKAEVLQHHSLEDPSQSWNALSIGGFTTKVDLPGEEPQLVPLAAANEKSPFSCGSQLLPPDLTPIKPEVLFEAGNMMVDAADNCDWHTAVSLVTTGKDVVNEPLMPFWATSAATGMAGNFVGRLNAALPNLWPETYRALTVHSAEWPIPIRSKLIGRGRSWKTLTKSKKQQLLRDVGYGVPDLGRAISSAKNDVTLFVESDIQPYAATADRRSAVFNEVHFYALPWPRAALEALENASVMMRVTLSYFVEPNLTGRASTRPDTYRSFGLRFAMKKRQETANEFRRRLSAFAGEREESGQETDYWLLGPQAVQAGSLHCDLWRGPAIDLARHDQIAIYPVGGWWKSHVGQRRMNDVARYALGISITAPEQDVDLYAEILAEIEARIAAEVAVEAGAGGAAA